MNGVLTTCGFCSCGCALYVEARNGRVAGLCPSTEHPVSTGRLCIKGWNATPSLLGPERLHRPLLRRGDRLQPASWEEVIAATASALKEISSDFGSQSVGIIGSPKLTNEECYSLTKFARGVLGTANVDGGSRLYDASMIPAFLQTIGSPSSQIDINSISAAGAILIVGANVRDQLAHIGSRIEDAVQMGCQVVVADPRRLTVAPVVHLFLQPRPGSDLLWIRALLKAIIDGHSYTKDAPRIPGFDDLRSSLGDVSMDRMSAEAGLDPGAIAQAVQTLAGNPPVTVMFGLGVLQQDHSTEIVKALADVALLLGGSIMPLRGQNNAQGASDMGLLHGFLPGYTTWDDFGGRQKWETAWNCQLPPSPGLSVLDMLRACEAGDVRALLVFGENLALSAPDTRATVNALSKVKFLAVSDLFLTETASLANVVFPACSFLEKDGTFTNIERRVQRVRKVLEPIGQARSDLEIIGDLASALGKDMDRDPASIMAEISAHAPPYRQISYGNLDGAWGEPWTIRGASPKLSPISGPASKEDSEYPLQLIASRIHYHQQTGTMCVRSSILSREYPETYAELNPGDAQRLGIRAGTLVAISSRSGCLTRTATLNGSLPSGCIHVPHFFRGDSPNRLASWECDAVSRVPIFKGCWVKVEAAK